MHVTRLKNILTDVVNVQTEVADFANILSNRPSNCQTEVVQKVSLLYRFPSERGV